MNRCGRKVFQFHNGSIKSRLKVNNHERTRTGFNSTMVRLKVKGSATTITGISSFQFHNGSIKRLPRLAIVAPDAEFQFHNGSIKSLHGFGRWRVKDPFQFHNGSIKSVARTSLTLGNKPFQFHNGSIKRYGRLIYFVFNNLVSIPQWFD